MQRGKFDHPDRLFQSVGGEWASQLFHTPDGAVNTQDVKELIPEFFCNPEFLKNGNELPLGTMQSGKVIDDVELPPWAQNCDDFVRMHRNALESDYVSEHLHTWINLIFGYQQRGKEAEDAVMEEAEPAPAPAAAPPVPAAMETEPVIEASGEPF